ncbi:MAG TPA: hypothetical protein VIY51_23935 [Xanthobacteraceae bacterium]
MARWSAAQQQALFKRVEDGFIFREPGLVPHHYLVSERQKAEIEALMRAPVGRPTPRHILVFAAAGLGLGMLPVGLEVLWMWANGDRQLDQWVGLIALMILLGVFAIASGRFRLHRIGPALAGARYTEQRITFRERNEVYARSRPLWMLIAAGVACALAAAWVVMMLLGPGHVPAWPMNPPTRLVAWFDAIVMAALAVRLFRMALLKLGRGLTNARP